MNQGLYDPRFEHDACGIGAVMNIDGSSSHRTVDDALSIVEKLKHRAGTDAAGETGDGVGILLQVPHALYAARLPMLEGLPRRGYGVGMFFFPAAPLARKRARRFFETILSRSALTLLGWREVPVHPEILSQRARDCMPSIWQCFVLRPEACEDTDFDRRLYVVRREFEQSATDTYVCSLSCRTVVYKGMFLVDQLRQFYDDLTDPLCESAMALVHSRFSTNTDPSWQRAHPNRLLCHNGEINTIRGNVARMSAREETMDSPLLREAGDKVLPVVVPGGSDSAMLDNVLEFLSFNGIPLSKAVMLAVPVPWSRNTELSRLRRDMYHYYATMMEPWDGPAALLYSDGDTVGAALDRNGLRPIRWQETRDGRLILASEVGVLDMAPEAVLRKSRLLPGSMLAVNLKTGRLLENDELKDYYARKNPYGEWLDRELVSLSSLPLPLRRPEHLTAQTLSQMYLAFGYHYEDIYELILPMAANGSEPTASMGADIPLAVLSEQHQPLFRYFRQQFAQVTNPPIDSVREEIVTDTTVYVGDDGNLLQDTAKNCSVLQINNPILTGTDWMKISALDMPGLKSGKISLLYYKYTSLERALERLCMECDKAYRAGCNILLLSDRGVDENHTPIPSLLAVAALEQHLIRTKKRTAISILLESGEPRGVHDFSTLLSYGARAVYPYVAHACIKALTKSGTLDRDSHVAIDTYNNAILKGVVKISAKMGISSLQSYQSAQVFEAVGIRPEVVEKYFTGTVSRVGGIGLAEIEEAVLWRHDRAFDSPLSGRAEDLDSSGFHKLRSTPHAEDHMYSPMTVMTLQKAVQENDYSLYRKYAELVDDEELPHTLRGLLEFAFDRATPIPIEQVEPVEEIFKRFKTGAMSYGSISQEAHECLALAMNAIGGKSNSGEGGEMPERLGTDRGSAIKQVASGRFGVTEEYLVSAKEIQIKLAQGAKPGEGGHLPGSKVWPWIAHTRMSTPGVSLISPPPHHDIYSIEDLAQLIYDLKCANRYADISVKLVSEAGVGTVAAGVAKAGARTILISGSDGGTGAAPLSSIHDAGLPWELGLAEAHQTLMRSGLRRSVRLETDGKLMTGRDVAVACLLGAEEFGFATAPLVALGCRMMRVCNLDTCPMGIATQNPELRKNFRGKPEYVIRLMGFIAQQLREIMARLGVRTVNELVGRTDLLRVRRHQITHRAEMVDLSAILQEDAHAFFDPACAIPFTPQTHVDESVLDALLKQPMEVRVDCSERTFGTLIGAEITRRYGSSLPENTCRIRCQGSAGQSFGAFIPKGLTLELCGDANDYFGKGLSGGRLIAYPPLTRLQGDVIVGNVALYGATSGQAFLCGGAGERFAVRNSGAEAVVEGVGDHGCEYMTGGTVVVLGSVGRNFAAGMSGGTAFVLDDQHDLYRHINKELVFVEPVENQPDLDTLHRLLTAHTEATGSVRGKEILADFPNRAREFKKVSPRVYHSIRTQIYEYMSQGMSREQAELQAFMERRN